MWMLWLAVTARAADGPSPLLRDPTVEAKTPAPVRYDIRFDTTRGPFVVAVHRDWAPLGADRLYHLVQGEYYDGNLVFRVIRGFMAQWGVNPQPEVNAAWRLARLPDDPVVVSNTRGRLTFAMAGPNTRTTQLFVNLADNETLDRSGFAPVGEVVTGWEVVEALYSGYGDARPRGRGPSQERLGAEGAAYAEKFPKLDRIQRATIVEPAPGSEPVRR